MDRITFSKGNCNEETASAWLIAALQFASKIDFFAPFKTFKLHMKEVKYSIYQKLITIIISIIMGCECTKDINEILLPEKVAANMFNMDRFPDQSQINILLTRMDEENISQLEKIHHHLFMQNSYSISCSKDVVVDLDQTGLIANGRSYELSKKGYFPKKKNQRGYQASAAFVGEHSETVALFLDPGNIHCKNRLEDLLHFVTAKFKEHLRSGKLIIRIDGGYGSADSIEILKAIPGLKFVVKGYSTKQSANLAKNVPLKAYTQADRNVWVYEFPTEEDGLRIILVQTLKQNGELVYSHLLTNISKNKMSAVEVFYFYNGRQTIEAFFKTAKNVYGIKNLRTRKFYGIYAFIWLVFITHILITWAKVSILKDTELQEVGVRTLIEKVGSIRAFVERTLQGIKIIIPPLTKLAKLLADTLSQPKYEQLCFQLPPI